MPTLTVAPISSLVAYRDAFTLSCGFAGVPIMQMWPLLPLVQRVLAGTAEPKPNDTFYQTVQDFSKGNKETVHNYEKLKALALDIKEKGILEPIPGWRIHNKIELWGGHHRACIAAALGMATVPINLYLMDVATEFECNPAPVVEAYNKVRSLVRLEAGTTYNPVAGFKSLRKGWDRAATMYEEIIDVKGTAMLDAGCNDGFFGSFFLLHGFHVHFLDYDANILSVAKARCEALERTARLTGWIGLYRFVEESLPEFLEHNQSRFDVVLFTDVMQHIATLRGAKAALDVLSGLLKITNERLVFAPGRKDVLEAAGVTERAIFDRLRGHRLKYLGRDSDGAGYGRELYVVYT